MAQITTVLAYGGTDGNKRATIILNGKNNTWTSSNNNLFETKNGRYKDFGDIELINSATRKRVAQFRGFAHKVGLVGTGLNDEEGEDLTWNVQSVDKPGTGSGSVGCFSSETKVLMADRTFKKISDIQQGDMLTVSNANLEIKEDEVAHVFQSYHEKIMSLGLSTGEKLEMSETQPIMTTSGPVSVNNLFFSAEIMSILSGKKLDKSLRFTSRDSLETRDNGVLYSIDTREDVFFFVGSAGVGVKCKGYGGPYGPPPRYLPK